MPTIRKRRYTRTFPKDRLTEDQTQYLLCGDCLDPAEGRLTEVVTVRGELTYRDYMPFENEADYRAAWEKHRAELMALMPDEWDYPKRLRPDAWWRFDAPEPKRQLSGPPPLPDSRLFRGEASSWASYEDLRAAVFETDLEYLRRLGLLRPGEEQQIAEAEARLPDHVITLSEEEDDLD